MPDLFNTAIWLILISFFFVFFSGGIAFFLFIIGVGLLVYGCNTPEMKAGVALVKENQKASVEYAKSLPIRFRQLSDNPTDIESLEFTLKALASFAAIADKSILKTWMWPVVIPLLKLKPLDKSIRDLVFDYAKKTITISVTRPDETSSKEVYDAALEILSEHPEQLPLRQYALEIGRWHYTIQRPNRKITIYDEQAIQNDIAVRSK